MKAKLFTGFITLLFIASFGSCKFDERSNDNDPKSSNYLASGITVNQAATSIGNGDTFVFSSATVNTTGTLEFNIVNSGAGDLVLTGSTRVSITDDASGYYSVSVQPASLIRSGESTTFTVSFSPLVLGDHTAAVTIESDDPDESNFVFYLTGACTPVPVPEINIKQGITDVASGGTVDFGSVVHGGNPKNLIFTIENTGNAVLTVSTPSKVDADNGLFTIDSSPASSVAGGGSTTFTITFAPASTGSKSAEISIVNSDSDEGTYKFTITGTGAAAAAPEINIVGGSTNIADSGSYSMGSAKQGETLDVTFTIQNLGTADLALTGDPRVSVSGASSSLFTVTSQPVSPISAGSSSTFTIRFAPGATTTAGTKNVTITVSNDEDGTWGATPNPDGDSEGTYSFTLSATCIEWYGKKTITSPVDSTSTSIDANGLNLFIAYCNDQANLYFAYSVDGGVNFTSVVVDEAVSYDCQHPSMKAYRSGSTYYIYIAYYDSTNGYLRYARTTFIPPDTFATTGWTKGYIDYSANVGQYAALNVEDTTTVNVAYYDVTNGDLKFARTVNSGSSWPTKVVVDSTGDVGLHPGIANGLHTDGSTNKIGISYYDNTNLDLKFAYSIDSGSTWSTATIESTGDVGMYSSVAFIDSRIFIAYYDYTNGDAKMARYLYSSLYGMYIWKFKTLSNTVTINSTNKAGGYISLYADANDHLHTAYTMYSGTTYTNMVGYFYHSVSADSGANWTHTVLSSSSVIIAVQGIYNDIVVTGNRVYISSIGGSVTSPTLRFAKSTDDGVTW